MLCLKVLNLKEKMCFQYPSKCHETGHIYKISYRSDFLTENIDMKYWKVGDNRGLFDRKWKHLTKGWVTHQFSYAMRHNNARGWEKGWGGGITNDILKMRKVIEFQSHLIQISFLCPATAHMCRWSISCNSNRQIM